VASPAPSSLDGERGSDRRCVAVGFALRHRPIPRVPRFPGAASYALCLLRAVVLTTERAAARTGQGENVRTSV
jgi:hypothetical protein